MKELKLVNQLPNSKECVIACIAMVSEIPIEELRDKYGHIENGINSFEEISFMHYLGIDFCLYSVPCMMWGRVYLITVPSLNCDGGSHRIVADLRTRNYIKLLDPNYGQEDIDGRASYDINKNYVDCMPSYFDVVEIFSWDMFSNEQL